ncbi:MAG: 16S rRNA (guanine(527)-N(7))-methyltransferase RsmG [Flavobacteriales bacterium]|nr:16S rRNA (guanine(527)-N(7))-methyltransferase RsmG [Flavobacteriales bacterium]MCB9194328.1 16S rRNA (guanine(527)-N(7))-methyltransferase RsmG [Flavobacteriales bacterium]
MDAHIQLITRYFPELDDVQRVRFGQLGPLYEEWNARVNLISRKDVGSLYERHVLHSLGLAKVCPFPDGTRVLDVGTGGGFPGIPMAILYPNVRFHLIDGIGKKIAAVQGIIGALGLGNATAEKARSEHHQGRYDVIVSRAVTTMPEFIRMTRHLVPKGAGRICALKGGTLVDELLPLRRPVEVIELSGIFAEDFFATKKVVTVRL